MTVSEIGQNKIKIILTDTEVLGCFGAYERLYSMSENIKAAINSLLRDIIREHKYFRENGKIIARIKASKNSGCEITLTHISSRRYCETTDYIFEFPDNESLTGGILMLYNKRDTRRLESSLYKIHNSYILIVKSPADDEKLLILKEFCSDISNSLYKAEHTREHGKELISKNAILKYGKAFFKGPSSS